MFDRACDRCGRTSEEQSPPGWRTMRLQADMFEENRQATYDLCDECGTSLVAWLESPP